ncbi:MAG: ATP-binding protein [Candidatus Protochlamydia sp.]|nr:ATP-binding protein [Candidatus Protochlamydia sp.]
MHKKKFPARIEQLHNILNFIKEYGKESNIDPSLFNKITLAAEEAIVNVINYGYPKGPGHIEVTCDHLDDNSGIRILIEDQGIPFNPIEKSRKRKKLFDPDKLTIGGYGIDIYFGIMDLVEYQRSENGNILSLIKYF